MREGFTDLWIRSPAADEGVFAFSYLKVRSEKEISTGNDARRFGVALSDAELA